MKIQLGTDGGMEAQPLKEALKVVFHQQSC
jgi:hypothetical protein